MFSALPTQDQVVGSQGCFFLVHGRIPRAQQDTWHIAGTPRISVKWANQHEGNGWIMNRPHGSNCIETNRESNPLGLGCADGWRLCIYLDWGKADIRSWFCYFGSVRPKADKFSSLNLHFLSGKPSNKKRGRDVWLITPMWQDFYKD